MVEDLEQGILKEMRGRGRSGRSRRAASEVLIRSSTRSDRRMMPPPIYEKLYKNCRSSDLLGNASALEIRSRSRNLASSTSTKPRMRCLTDLNNGVTASKELLKVLIRIWRSGEKPSSTVSLVSALRAELDGASVNVGELIREETSDNATAKEGRKDRDRERIRAAFRSVAKELETEKARRERTERLNEELAAELAEVRAALVKTSKELERERRSREVIEKVWNESARGVARDKADAEAMRVEYRRAKEEMEKEREMLRIADEWREERVQMKLSEAKLRMEEKNAAIDRLRNELEAFLEDKRKETGIENANVLAESKNRPFLLGMVANGSKEGEDEDEEEDEDGVESEDSDLHSIELNMDSKNNSYRWSYAAATNEHEGKSAEIEHKIDRGRMRNGIERDFDVNFGMLGGDSDGRGEKNILTNGSKSPLQMRSAISRGQRCCRSESKW